MLIDKLKRLFARDAIPDETRRLFEKAGTTRDLIKGLDDLYTVNELEFNSLAKEAERLEEAESRETVRVRDGGLTERQKRTSLMSIQRLGKQQRNIDARIDILDKNMNLHLNLIGKIQEVEAMQLRGVGEEQIDKILTDFEESLDQFTRAHVAGKLAERTEDRQALDRDLSRLEAKILSEAPTRKKTKARRKESGDGRMEEVE